MLDRSSGCCTEYPTRAPTWMYCPTCSASCACRARCSLPAEFSSPWAVESPDPDALASIVMPDAECVVLFHVLIEGECVVECESHAVGEDGNRRRRSSFRTATSTPCAVATHAPVDASHVRRSGDAGTSCRRLVFGGGGWASRFICGYLNCDQRFSPLVERAADDAAGAESRRLRGDRGDRCRRPPADGRARRASGTWLGTTLKFTINEARVTRPGNAAMLGRLTELMFVEILREYMQRLPASHGGWLAGLNDSSRRQRAAAAARESGCANWTVEGLAREVAVSRSVLAQRFTEMVGETPMRYLANWRMQLAKQMMREGSRNIQEIATRVGYESEAAFNRAFKRATGSPPATWRKVALSASVQ